MSGLCVSEFTEHPTHAQGVAQAAPRRRSPSGCLCRTFVSHSSWVSSCGSTAWTSWSARSALSAGGGCLGCFGRWALLPKGLKGTRACSTSGSSPWRKASMAWPWSSPSAASRRVPLCGVLAMIIPPEMLTSLPETRVCGRPSDASWSSVMAFTCVMKYPQLFNSSAAWRRARGFCRSATSTTSVSLRSCSGTHFSAMPFFASAWITTSRSWRSSSAAY
mmetsp:Transcript_103476/g.223364  ORF Transcript_103476/g.223364 Transcript_103476/m.223364 type:complete len:219 (+) Transcript_103476:1775-2431(+)